jgi:hypothetical protein
MDNGIPEIRPEQVLGIVWFIGAYPKKYNDK